MGNASRLEPMLQDGLRKFADHPLVGEVRGTGLIAGIEMAKDRATKASSEPAGKMAPKVVEFCVEEGLIVRAVYETVAFCPPLIVTEDDISEILARFGRALDKALDWAQAEGLL